MGKDSNTIKSALVKLKQIQFIQWECLRRNGDYNKDCEKWTRRKYTEWSRAEVFLKPYFSKANAEKNDTAASYTSFIAEVDAWSPYAKKHCISKPVNPKCSVIPKDAHLLFEGIISDHRCYETSQSESAQAVSPFLRVNWAAPARYLCALFEQKVMEKQQTLIALSPARKIKAEWIVQPKGMDDVRMRYEQLEKTKNTGQLRKKKYQKLRFGDDRDIRRLFQIWDLRIHKKLTFSRIAEIVFKGSTNIPTAASISKSFEKANRLIEGDYKTLLPHV